MKNTHTTLAILLGGLILLLSASTAAAQRISDIASTSGSASTASSYSQRVHLDAGNVLAAIALGCCHRDSASIQEARPPPPPRNEMTGLEWAHVTLADELRAPP